MQAVCPHPARLQRGEIVVGWQPAINSKLRPERHRAGWKTPWGPAASDFGTANAQWPDAAPPVKFLTVRNLITPTPRRSYDCVSVNSLQYAHPSALPPPAPSGPPSL